MLSKREAEYLAGKLTEISPEYERYLKFSIKRMLDKFEKLELPLLKF